MNLQTPTGPALSDRAAQHGSSAVRDLLAQAARPGMISLAGGLPDAELFPVEEIAAVASELISSRGRTVLQYGRTEGLDEARAALSNRFDLGDPDGVIITTGSQQGLDLLINVLVDPGDEVVVSDPEYLGMLQVLRSHGARPVAIPSDRHGLDVSDLAARLATGFRPKACYVVPHFHNPSGSTLAADRRAELHRLSSHYGFVVIEDDPYRDLYHDHSPAPADVDADPTWTVRLRTTSKSLAPGLRVAVVQAPQPLRDALVIAKQSADLHTSSLNQAIVAELVEAPWFEDHLDRLRRAYQAKCDAMVEVLLDSFGDGIRLARPSGGMFLWVDASGLGTPGAPLDASRWLAGALEEGVCFVPGGAFGVDRPLDSFVRLSFATASSSEVTEAVARMARALLAA